MAPGSTEPQAGDGRLPRAAAGPISELRGLAQPAHVSFKRLRLPPFSRPPFPAVRGLDRLTFRVMARNKPQTYNITLPH